MKISPAQVQLKHPSITQNFSTEPKESEKMYHNEKFTKAFGCLKRRKHWTKMPDRKIQTNLPDIEVPDNRISTSKYTKITFFPKNLFEQFSKLSNSYFLVIGILQVFPEITNTNGEPLIYFPLGVIIAISMLKDFLEDHKRWKSDHEENTKNVECLNELNVFKTIAWKDLHIGNIVRLKQNDSIPADLLVLITSEPNGVCFVETKNLDGETNLKQKGACKDLAKLYTEPQTFGQNLWFNYERPNPYLYKFSGNMEISPEDKIPLDQQNFLLRGSNLRNTGWVIGTIAYTGHDTKIMLNSVRAKSKRSKVEKFMNIQIFIIFIIQIAFCVLCAWAYVFYYNAYKSERSYLLFNLGQQDSTLTIIFIEIGSWILLFINFVPISLLVTLELVKFMQASILSYDDTLKSPVCNMNATVQSSNLNEELGQIQYIFSDKTGTLTCNIMEFKNISIGGISYGDDDSLESTILEKMPKVTNVDFKDQNFFQHLEDYSHENNNLIRESLRELAICHSVIIDDNCGEITYNASSQDEIALVNFARFAGYEYNGIKDSNTIMVKTKDEIEEYKLLNTLEFDSTRKRMSTLVQNSQGQIILYCKGADTIILERLNKSKGLITQTWKNMDRYAVIGLRTLVLTKKVLDSKYYEDWSQRYKEACSAIQDRDAKMETLQDEIERDLELVSVTAIEDKLQQDVAPTIQILKEAGIQIWVLTGDKIETAINVALSCNLLNEQMNKIIIDGKSEDSVVDSLNKAIFGLEKNPLGNYALIISGDALIVGMVQPILTIKIMKLAENCKAVVACRVSPKQKQEIVTMVRTAKPKAITLAIGDGANDVNMISAAHVGIGIRGLEGQQAVRASDYAIGEFRFLRKLVLSFGRECYRKNTSLICYNFYKNVLLVLPHFWFSFFNDFSGQLLYDSWLYQCFNLFYCALPIIIYALFDEEYPTTKYVELKNPPVNILETNPNLYDIGFESKLFNSCEFWSWILNGTYQSAVLVFISFFGIDPYFVQYNGAKSYDFMSDGMVIFTQCVLIANFKILNFSNSFHPFSLLIIIASILFYILNLYVVNALQFFASYGLFPCLMSIAYFYICCILAVLATNLMDCAGNRLLRLFREVHNYKVLPLKLETSKMNIKGSENYNDQVSPSFIDKNSTHDNKIFDGNSNSFRNINLKKTSREATPPEISRKNTLNKFFEESKPPTPNKFRL